MHALTLADEPATHTLVLPPATPPPFRNNSHEWNLVNFLPRALHQPLILLLAEWMYLPWQEANRAAAAARSGATQGGSQAVLDARQGEQVQVRAWPGGGEGL
jgi:hypothetical protein